MSIKRGNTYSSEFRESSVKLALESKHTIAQTARDLGVKDSTLHTWISKYSGSKAMKTANDVRKQLLRFCEKNKIDLEADTENTILQALSAGHFMQCAVKQPDGSYKTFVGRNVVYLHPSSILHGAKEKPACVIYHELTFTSKCYLRSVSAVDPKWIAEYTRLSRK